jgi:hypothetical protein
MYVEGAILVFRVGVRVVPPELIPPEGEEVSLNSYSLLITEFETLLFFLQ